MARVISFSLYGWHPMYYEGMLRNCELAKTVYPEWFVWVYCGPDVSKDWRTKIEMRGGKVIDAVSACRGTVLANRINHTGMFWRFLPARDKNVEMMISRDSDSRLNVRERGAVDEWINSGLKFHAMRDHPNHRFHVFMGGMWGVRGHLDILALLRGYMLDGHKGEDQEFLKAKLLPLTRGQVFEHGVNGKPFPPHAQCNGFVGQRYTETDVGLPD